MRDQTQVPQLLITTGLGCYFYKINFSNLRNIWTFANSYQNKISNLQNFSKMNGCILNFKFSPLGH